MRASRRGPFLLASFAVHLALVFGLGWLVRPDGFDDLVPPEPIDLGIVEGDSGGGPKPGPPPAPAPTPPEPAPERRRPPAQKDSVVVAVDAGRTPPSGDAAPDAGLDASVTDGGVQPSGHGSGHRSAGTGFGFHFGTGGIGLGTGGVPGAMIGLHADLGRIRESSLVLETDALLDLLPGWREIFVGSGIEPLDDFDRVLVATPDLTRAHTVVSASVRGGDSAIRRAASRLGGGDVAWSKQQGVPTAPWRSGSDRVAALLAPGQVVIARREDVARVRAVAAGLAVRNATLVGMEHAAGDQALLAMRDDEAVAISVEGARAFVTRNVRAVPESLRISVRSLDEFHSELRAVGTYANAGEAERAVGFVDALRTDWLDHPRVSYLGIRSALEEAALGREGPRVTLRMRLTLHQTRYLAKFVSRALRPRD